MLKGAWHDREKRQRVLGVGHYPNRVILGHPPIDSVTGRYFDRNARPRSALELDGSNAADVASEISRRVLSVLRLRIHGDLDENTASARSG